MQILDLTWVELGAIRQEVLYEGNSYTSYIEAIEYYKSDYANTESYNSVVRLCKLYLNFDRLDQAKESLSLLSSSLGVEPDAGIDYAMLSAIYHRKKFSLDCDEDRLSFDDLPEIRKTLSVFQEGDDSNRVMGRYDPTVYWRQWIELIDLYFSIRESAWNEEQGNEKPTLGSIFAEALSPQNRARTALLRFEPEFVASLSSKDLDMLRKHDSILLELIPYCPEEYHSQMVSYSPIFRGTEILLWHRKLHLIYPSKLDEFLNGIPESQNWHEWNVTEEQLKSRLLNEFPSRQEEINEWFTPSEMDDAFDDDDSDDDDSDDDDSDDSEIESDEELD